MKIAIIGAGNMGGAICKGLLNGGHAAADICVSNPSRGKLDDLKRHEPGLRTTTSNAEAATGAYLIILAVKPWLVRQVLEEIKLDESQTLVSVAAGVSFSDLATFTGLKSQPMFRVIPNTAISHLESMTIIASQNATAEQEESILQIFGTMGKALLVPEEKMAAATSLTSCGIAYVLKYIQAAMQAGIELGIRPADAGKMVAQSVKGAATLVLENKQHPAIEIEKVCTPGGLTIKGINQLEHDGFTSAVINAMKASMK